MNIPAYIGGPLLIIGSIAFAVGLSAWLDNRFGISK